MGAGPSTNLYSIGGDRLTQIILCYYIFSNFFFKRNAGSDKIHGKYVVGEPLTQFCYRCPCYNYNYYHSIKRAGRFLGVAYIVIL